jgi:prefoldin subunit 5
MTDVNENALRGLAERYNKLKKKADKQRNEIARLQQNVDKLMADNRKLLADIKWMRGET